MTRSLLVNTFVDDVKTFLSCDTYSTVALLHYSLLGVST